MTKVEWYNQLRQEFSTLEEAKIWIRKWYDKGQMFEGEMFSCRAMAGHVSTALEDKNDDSWWSYMDTKYGSELFNAMF